MSIPIELSLESNVVVEFPTEFTVDKLRLISVVATGILSSTPNK